nr:MAG: hypothetical protein [Bacteriophage sp.]
MENIVQITNTEFENLLKAKFDLEMVKHVLLNGAKTDWSGKYLTWDDAATSAVLRHIMGDAYDKKLEELTKEAL